jgi:hypothetical protein
MLTHAAARPLRLVQRVALLVIAHH